MKILIIGSGGREHAIGWKLIQSKQTEKIFFMPGNGGTNKIGENININPTNYPKLYSFIEQKKIKLIIIGPEQPLVDGIVDKLTIKFGNTIKIIGPSKNGAKLEGSKIFAKKFMTKYKIPTAKYQAFTNTQLTQAYGFLKTLTPPYVIKANGLAAGKGVIITNNIKQAEKTIKQMFDGKYAEASEKIVIEEFLHGIELSVFVITDGENYKILPTSKDYKKIGENDTGPNTGGMGAVSPVPFATDEFMQIVENQIIIPTIAGLKTEKINYTGFIYFGLMNHKGKPYVIEYNARMGDPETQAVLPLIKTDFLDLMTATADKKLNETTIEIENQTTVAIVLASLGYPNEYEKNKKIEIKPNIHNDTIFHAGTHLKNNQLLTNGGRVISVVATGKSIKQATEKAYKTIEKIKFEKMYYRKDIGKDLLLKS